MATNEHEYNQWLSKAFMEIFEGFPLAFGTDSGGCRWEPVTEQLMYDHLTGENQIGIYPMVYDPYLTTCGPDGYLHNELKEYPNMQEDLWMCKWGAMDIDEGVDSLIIARNAQTILKALDIESYVELSKSKGCHVWVFADEWTPAFTMRRAMMAALQLADATYDAVFPKQDSLPRPPGNYVRLPYGAARPKGRQEILDERSFWDKTTFVNRVVKNLTPKHLLVDAATHYKAPVVAQPDLPPPRDYSKEPLMRVDGSKLRGLPKQMYESGPVSYYKGTGAGRGRHGFLNRFARAMFEAGYSASDVVAWTKDLDSRLSSWYEEGPKFTGRNDCDRQIERLVSEAGSRAS